MNQIVDLDMNEVDQVGGGALAVPLLALAFTVISAMCVGGYMVGKDMAERDNAKN